MTKTKGRILIAIVLCHLAIVAMGAAYVEFDRYGKAGKLLSHYAEITGAGDAYGFFAPGIDGQPDVYFNILNKEGKTTKYRLENGSSHESDLRVGDIFDQFQSDVDDIEEFRRSLSASLAAAVFARNSDARAVTVHLDQFRPVSMADYRAGLRPKWESQYVATFEYRPQRQKPKPEAASD